MVFPFIIGSRLTCTRTMRFNRVRVPFHPNNNEKSLRRVLAADKWEGEAAGVTLWPVSLLLLHKFKYHLPFNLCDPLELQKSLRLTQWICSVGIIIMNLWNKEGMNEWTKMKHATEKKRDLSFALNGKKRKWLPSLFTVHWRYKITIHNIPSYHFATFIQGFRYLSGIFIGHKATLGEEKWSNMELFLLFFCLN